MPASVFFMLAGTARAPLCHKHSKFKVNVNLDVNFCILADWICMETQLFS